MRVILAGMLVFACMLAMVSMISSFYPEGDWPWWSGPAIAMGMLCSAGVVMFVLNKRGYRPNMPFKTLEEQMAALEKDALLTRESFKAIRAFEVEEFEDEGLHYYLELENKNVLCLNGQYLYDFEPIDDDPEINQARKFPCTDFTIIRHREAGYVIDIECRGDILEPEETLPPYNKLAWKKGLSNDGEIFTTVRYEQIKESLQ